MKIVVLDSSALEYDGMSWEPMEKLGSLEVYHSTPSELILDRIGDAGYVFVNGTPLTAQTINTAPNLKWIGVLSTGYNLVDTDAAAKRQIPVCNSPGYAASTVAELAFCLLLEIVRGVGDISRTVMGGGWKKGVDFYSGRIGLQELFGKTYGVIGFGDIGRRSAAIARGFGMDVLVHDDYVDRKTYPQTRFVTLDELLEQSDVVSLHCPLNDQTKHIINKESIEKMKDEAVLINTARGGLVDEDALCKALNSGKLAAAGCDSVSEEPIRPDNPLMTARNAMITPHIGWASREARQRLMDVAVKNLASHLSGKTINVVNMPF